jgi:hypothetical protein
VEGGGGGLTVSGVTRNRGSFVKCVAIRKKVGNPWCRGTEENYENPQLGQQVSGIRFEPGYSQIRNRDANLSAAIFGVNELFFGGKNL